MSSRFRRTFAALLILLTPLSLTAQGPAPIRAGLAPITSGHTVARVVDVGSLRARGDSGETWSTEVGLGLGIVGGLAALIWGNSMANASESSGRNNALPGALFFGAVLGATGALIGFFFPKK
jgi:F0F1-type ATP synthase membrane subunit c/vacuolar-type H+-ATPase subunit K